jgi:Fic family protein
MWRSTVGGLGTPRKDRAGGLYRAYVPDPIADQPFSFEGAVAADVADAAVAIARLDIRAHALTNTEALARILLRAESVASSRIEGLVVSPQRLLRADSDRAAGATVTDHMAAEVLANVDAMEYAIGGSGDITVDRLREVHRRLLEPTRAAAYAGVVRTEQNWIGGSTYNPIAASFVPPPAEEVPPLLDDLCAFCNDDTLPAVAQAAIAHAQFETIHPFVDGNGRAGRALIYMVLRRRGLASRATPPISLVLATRSKEYIALLGATRYEGRATSTTARQALNAWVAFFAAASVLAVADAESFEQRIVDLQASWRGRLGGVRSDSSVFAILDWLPAAPIITANVAAKLSGRTFAAANNALAVLAGAGILTPSKSAQRNRTFEAREVVDAFTALERRLASPAADTRIERPVRPVPSRPRR